ncbi:hypothetical protein D9611_000225 [Ephemerocybe angulata]|uniref:UV excision repair protein RAD23 n=1 Tax=Ephemerocybe angulata TaxID=980116 RepID=A0A8H5BNZ5_9AGAR|nr:hypothetical protein D9611_000225 [Tulosesus angulatus]
MKITVKTTQQKVYQIDVEGQETVGTLKAKIESEHGHAVASQKVIYSGKILSDDKTIESCGIKEKDFLVLMVSKPKTTPAASTSSTPAPAPAPAAAPEPAPAPAPVAAPPAAVPAATPEAAAPAPAAQDQSAALGSSFLSGAAYQSAVTGLVEMGFERDQVVRAMRASFNNPDRAVEYLMSGIPAHLEAEAAGTAAPQAQAAPAGGAAPAAQQAPAAAAPAGQPQNLFQLAQQQQQQGGGAAAGGTLPGGLNLDAIRNSPQIQQLREALQQNPESAQALLQQLAVQNPGIAQLIAQNPNMLYDLLGIEADGEGEDGDIPPGAQVVSVTPEERAAIERLEGLGFTRQQALEAFLACDKNEELAANYLFEANNFD